MTVAAAPGRSSSGLKIASEDRVHADRREGISRDEGPVEPLGEAIRLRDDHRSVRERREIGEAAGGGPPVGEVEVRHTAGRPAIVNARDRHDAVAVGDRQAAHRVAR